MIGGGIAGMVAARDLARSGAQVTLFEASERLGGKLQTIAVPGDGGEVGLELGADSFLAMKPEAVALARELGLELVGPGPAASRTYLLRGGRLRPLPTGLAMGVPTGLRPLFRCVTDGIIGPLGAMRAGLEPWLPSDVATRPNATVEEVTRRRLGRQVADRLIAPLVGGVFGAPPSEVGFVDAFPPMATTRSLVLAMMRRPTAPADTPTFMTPREGLQRMVDKLHEELRTLGVSIELRTHVEHLPLADAVVLATSAPIAAGLLDDAISSDARENLGQVRSHASAVFLLRFEDLGRELDGGGYLVAPDERGAVAATTWLPAKWPHHPWADPWIRAIVTDTEALTASDEDLRAQVADEVGRVLQGTAVEVRMHRWPSAIPVYAPGHRDRMRVALGATPDGVALAGAAYRGPGIPDCIASAQEAVQHVLRNSSNPR